ncbi:MAG: DUF1684 domain-containing protein [Oligoflexales bacterium]|nr:DUF1684 domain-containing protein [Oligoflexales bacterium]
MSEYNSRESHSAATYEEQIEQWRVLQDLKLRAEDGWLSVVGLSWLQSGENSIGSGVDKSIVLPEGTPEVLGTVILKDGEVSLVVAESGALWIDGKPAVKGRSYPLHHDEDKNPTMVDLNHRVMFFVIKRANGLGIRIKDKESQLRSKFKGRSWYPVQKDWLIEASWVPLEGEQEIMVPDILGNESLEKISGYAEFEREGKLYRLYPRVLEDGLFFIFRDRSSVKSTYGAGRFLRTALAQKGKVEIDFNKAVNPPCAFTHFATCPLPPKENIIDLVISSGELRPYLAP